MIDKNGINSQLDLINILNILHPTKNRTPILLMLTWNNHQDRTHSDL